MACQNGDANMDNGCELFDCKSYATAARVQAFAKESDSFPKHLNLGDCADKFNSGGCTIGNTSNSQGCLDGYRFEGDPVRLSCDAVNGSIAW